MTPNNIQTSIAHLNRQGFVVFKHPSKPLYDVHRIGHKQYCHSPNYKPWISSRQSRYYKYDQEPYIYTVRGLIQFAQDYSSNSKQRTTIKGNVKRFDKGKNRTAERCLINSRDLDKIEDRASHHQHLKTEDIWCWD